MPVLSPLAEILLEYVKLMDSGMEVLQHVKVFLSLSPLILLSCTMYSHHTEELNEDGGGKMICNA